MQNPQTQSTKGFAGNVTGDPYGNRIEQMPFCKLSKSASNDVNKPNYNKIQQLNYSAFSQVFVTLADK